MFVVCCVGSCLCEELITHSGESNRVCVCDLDISTVRQPRPEWGCCATEKKIIRNKLFLEDLIVVKLLGVGLESTGKRG